MKLSREEMAKRVARLLELISDAELHQSLSKELARNSGYPRQTVQFYLRLLEARGLVEKVPFVGAYAYRITGAGQKGLKEYYAAVKENKVHTWIG